MPKISVITVCFNAEQHIEQTIKSVINQQGCDLEYIVIDGGSTDSTLRIVKQFEAKITKWMSEPDKGIADAMNKGIDIATGDYIIFLHADDYFITDNVVSDALDYMDADADIYAFNVLFQTQKKDSCKRSRAFGLRTYIKTPVMHQGAFCKKTLLTALNGFNASYKIAMDYDFFYRAYQYKAIMDVHSDLTVSLMRDTGVSSRQDWPSLKQRFAEEKRVHLENNTSVFMKGIYAVYWALYLPYRKVLFDVKSAVSREQ